MVDETRMTTPSSVQALSDRLAEDLGKLHAELGEVDLLIAQARTEAERHETRRVTASDKLAALTDGTDAKDRLDQATALVTLTKRSALMATQVDVLEGKRRALARYRDGVAGYLTTIGGIDPSAPEVGAALTDDATVDEPMSPAVMRLVMGAQEDLRREIARAMHDGPAQSLTNIVLQAQIVERLVARDPAASADGVRQLIAMVQHTLDATKSFIFDVRPMVLDDLGMVPTLRRATRERGRRAGIPVEFESLGQDRRLPMDLESGLFRMLDVALVGYLSVAPERVTLQLDWGDRLEANVVATRAVANPTLSSDIEIPTEDGDKDLPPALAAMVEDRRAGERYAADAAVRDSIVVLPESTWREIRDRAASVSVTAELAAGGSRLHLVAELPASADLTAMSHGQGLVEYGLILALSSVLTLIWLGVFGETIADALAAIGIAIDQAAGG